MVTFFQGLLFDSRTSRVGPRRASASGCMMVCCACACGCAGWLRAQDLMRAPLASQSPYLVGSSPRGPSRSPVDSFTTDTITGSAEWVTGPHWSGFRAGSGFEPPGAACEVALAARGRCARSCAEETRGRRGAAVAAAAAAAAAAGVAEAEEDAGAAGVAAAADEAGGVDAAAAPEKHRRGCISATASSLLLSPSIRAVRATCTARTECCWRRRRSMVETCKSA